MITAEQLKDVLDRTEALKRYLNIDAKLIQVEEEQLCTQAPGFWDDPKKAEIQMKRSRICKVGLTVTSKSRLWPMNCNLQWTFIRRNS